MTSACLSGNGRVASTIDGEYAERATGTAGPGLSLGPVDVWFVNSSVETCTLTLQVDKLRNIAAGANTPAWVAGRSYVEGDLVRSGANLYVCTVAGTSGATGPAGSGRAILDGTVTWDFAAALSVVIGSSTHVLQLATAP